MEARPANDDWERDKPTLRWWQGSDGYWYPPVPPPGERMAVRPLSPGPIDMTRHPATGLSGPAGVPRAAGPRPIPASGPAAQPAPLGRGVTSGDGPTRPGARALPLAARIGLPVGLLALGLMTVTSTVATTPPRPGPGLAAPAPPPAPPGPPSAGAGAEARHGQGPDDDATDHDRPDRGSDDRVGIGVTTPTTEAPPVPPGGPSAEVSPAAARPGNAIMATTTTGPSSPSGEATEPDRSPSPGTRLMSAVAPLFGAVATTAGCHPSYLPCVPVAEDVDCRGEAGGDGPGYTGAVRVVGPDDYRLDPDGDGLGCE